VVQRQQLMADLAPKLGGTAQELTLRKIAERVHAPYDGQLRQVRDDLFSRLSQLQTANQRNRELIEHVLLLLRGSFNLLNALMTSTTVYHCDGGIQRTGAAGKSIRSEI
jgi:flagellar biosynthesis/type III secretory pathway chaperone